MHILFVIVHAFFKLTFVAISKDTLVHEILDLCVLFHNIQVLWFRFLILLKIILMEGCVPTNGDQTA